MNTLKHQPISYTNLLLWCRIYRIKSTISSTASGLVTTCTKPLRSWVLATIRFMQSVKMALSPTARPEPELPSWLTKKISSNGLQQPGSGKTYVRLKAKLWHGQFGAEKDHFELHIRGKALEVITGSCRETLCQVLDETGENWTVFYDWIEYAEAPITQPNKTELSTNY